MEMEILKKRLEALKEGHLVDLGEWANVQLVLDQLGLAGSKPRYRYVGASTPSSSAPAYDLYDLPNGEVFKVGCGFDQSWPEGRILRGKEAEDSRELKGENFYRGDFYDDVQEANKIAMAEYYYLLRSKK